MLAQAQTAVSGSPDQVAGQAVERAQTPESLIQLRLQTDQPAGGLDLSELYGGVSFDGEIQSPEQFFGFPLAARHLRHDQLVAYARYLANASPHLRLLPYADSHGGRPLYVLMAHRNADDIELPRLLDRRRELTQGQAESLSSDRPVVYFGYSIHGDEASGANAFPAVAYYLAAADDSRRNQVLDEAVLLLDPCLNPDGSDRFANWANENRGLYANPSDSDREHNQPWPGGRTNYYWFDLNRDWLPTTHPESRGRIALFHRWKPNVVLDFHEMGGSSSYFFQPGIPARNNPLTPDTVFKLTKAFARQHAAAFDVAGEAFFTEERFDDFYMGKGSTYPDLHGAIGILFEQGSTRGLISHNDQFQRTFAETVANQIRTSLSSIDATLELRNQLLQHQLDFYATATARAEAAGITAYLLTAAGDSSRLVAAAELLNRHQISCWRNAESLQVDGQTWSPGQVLIVPTAQPECRFLESLMQTQQTFQENIFYDVSTWHLPSAFDLDAISYQSDLPEAWRKPYTQSSASDSSPSGSDHANVIAGFAIDPVSLEAPRLVAKLLANDVQVRVAYAGFETGSEDEPGRAWPAGTWLVLRAVNQQRWDRAVELLTAADQAALTIGTLRSGLTEIGPDLGSNDNWVVPQPRVLLVVGDGTSSYGVGSLWYFLDHRLRLPVTLVDTDRLSRIDLRDYSCIVLPAGSFSDWGQTEIEALQNFTESGGTLVAVESAIGWLQRKQLLSKVVDDENGQSAEPSANGSSATSTPPRFGEAADRKALESIAGAIFQTAVDSTHPLAFGFPDEQVPAFRTSTSRYPLPKNPYATAAQYDSVLAGYVSQDNRQQLAGTAAVWAENIGRGRIICIADNPVFRGYFRGSERFLSNAVLIGPTIRVP
ncbi:M14 family metallopeptidase [Planctomycetaceae bacterium SH139]